MTIIQQQSGKYKRDQLVREIINLLLVQHKTEQTVLAMLMDPDGVFQYGKDYSYELIREARKHTAEVYADWAVGALETMLADLYEQREQTKNDKTLKSIEKKRLVFDISKEIAKLKGLYIERHEVTHRVEQPLFNIELPAPEVKTIDIPHTEEPGEDKGLF